MAAIYEYTGVVEKVLQLQTFASGFTKRDVVMTDDVGTESKWPNHIAFTFKKDAASMLDSVREGQRAKIRFAIDGREWTNPQGQVKYFTDLTGLKIEVLNADGSSTEPVPAPAEPDFPDDAGAVDDMISAGNLGTDRKEQGPDAEDEADRSWNSRLRNRWRGCRGRPSEAS